jgi:primase-polymerase (primpol)-like protein
MSFVDRIPEELRKLKQWIIWRREDRDGEPTKVPYTTMGYRASSTNPDHWSTFEAALAAAARPGFCDGVGFVFAKTDPYTGVDLDDVWQSDADEGAPWAAGILERFRDTYSEASPSNRGVKVWCRARAPRCGRWTIAGGAIEVYDHARFFAVTGRSAGIVEITDHQADVEALIANLDGDRPRTQAEAIPNIIPRGRRHNSLLSLAGTMHRRGMAPEAIEAALLEVDRRQCDPPHGAQHVRKIVASMRGWER